jgi:hypothetical protein
MRHITARSLAPACLCVLLVGSAANASGPPDVSIPRALRANPGAPTGCLAGSMGRPAARRGVAGPYHFWMNIESDASKKHAQVTWDGVEGVLRKSKQAVLRDGDELRDVFLVCLRPGTYQLREAVVRIGTEIFSLDKPFENLAIDVVADQTKYIGSFVLYTQWHAIDPCGRSNTMRLVARNRADTDVPVLVSSSPYPIVEAMVVKASQPGIRTCS